MGLSFIELKKKLGLDKIPVIHKPILVKKDNKHLYYVAGYFYPLKWQTLERLNIPSQKILLEVDREQWHKEQAEAREKKDEIQNIEKFPFEYEE
jgi:hypothetical protein